MSKPLPEDYKPSNPPNAFKGWHRWIVDELFRIARRFNANPITLVLKQFAQPITIPEIYARIALGIGAVPEIDHPGGNYDSVTGEWTCPVDGLYSVDATVSIQGFGGGNKAYEADIILFVNDVETFSAIGSAVDDVALTVHFYAPVVFEGGDKIRFELGALHTQQGGDSTFDYSMSIVRLGIAQ